MRRKLGLIAAAVVTANLIVLAAPAHACHDVIITSENPIYNWACMTVHDVIGP